MRGNTATYEQVRAERVEAAKVEGDHYRALAASDDREVNPNWWVINEPEVEKAVRQATAKVRAQFGETFEGEDLESEAWIAAARIADRAAACLAGENGHNMGTFQHELEMDLLDLCRPIYGRHHLTAPGFEVEDEEAGPSRLFDQVGTLRGDNGVEWTDAEAAVL